MKRKLLLSSLLIFLSVSIMGQNFMGQLERFVQLWEFHESKVKEIKNRSPYQPSINVTEAIYSFNRSTTLSLKWLDTRIENREGYIWIYKLKGRKEKLHKKLIKGYYDTYSTKVKSYNRYSGEIETFTVKIVLIPENVYVYLKRGLSRLEDYSMR